MPLADMIARTKKIATRFPITNWTAEIRTLDLVEEVGELCRGILEHEGHKTMERASKEVIVDSLCDVLYDVILLFDHYGVPVESTYAGMLDELERRIAAGEWDHPRKP